MNKIEIDQLRMWSHGGPQKYQYDSAHFWKEKIKRLIDHLDEVQFDLDDMRRNTEEYRRSFMLPPRTPMPTNTTFEQLEI